MKRLIILVASCLLIAILGHAADDTTTQAKPETYFIVKYFDHAKMLSYKLVSQTEYKALLEEIAGEAKIWDKTMTASEKAWKAEGSTTKRFPRNAISQKKVMIVDRFTDQEKATAKLNNLEQALTEAEEARQKNIEEQQKKLSKIMGNKKTDDRGASDREAFLESARSLFDSKLSELSGGTLGSQETAAPAAEDKEKDKKADEKK